MSPGFFHGPPRPGTAHLDPALCYAFELTAPENRIIVPYTERRLTWLAAWDRATLAELALEALPDLPAPRVREYPLQTLAEVLTAVAAIEPFAAEGFVVRDADGRRLKIKGDAYVMADRVLSRLSTPRRKVEALLSAQYDDMVPHLPNHVRADLMAIGERLAVFQHNVRQAYEACAGLRERKAFAAEALKSPYSALLFQLYDGAAMEDCLRRVHPDKLAEWLGLKSEEAADGA